MTVLAVLTGVVSPMSPAQAAPDELPTETAALAAAKRFGEPVEVAGLRSETTTVVANPAGTLTATMSPRPVRVRTGSGWKPVDTVLRRRSDGEIEATSSPLPARLSGGGDGPLYTLGSASVKWPGKLPEPVLDDAVATYREVLPGVDLTVRLDVDAVTTAFVVKSREAEKALLSHDFSLKPADSGEFRSTSAEKVPAPDGAVFPMAVAPITTKFAWSAWTMINQRHPDQSYWSHDRDQGAKVGYVEDARDGWERYRSIFAIPMGALTGKHVLRAWFSSYLNHSYSCSNTRTDLFVVPAVNAETDWSGHAGTWARYLAGATNNDCKDAGVYSEWAGDAVTKAAQDGAGWGTLTLGLKAADEDVINEGWKKFDETRTALSVEYNSYPGAPDLLSVEGKACNGSPLYVGTKKPVLRARPRDPDGQMHEVWFAYGERRGSGGEFINWQSTHVDNIPEGAVAQYKVPQELGDGKLYGFHSQSNDGIDAGAKSNYCEFVVDVTPPHAAPGIKTTDGRYPSDGDIHGGVGISGDFTFTSGNVNDVAGYYYGISTPPTDFVAATVVGGQAVAGVTPEWRGSNKLYVSSVDRAGNLSPIAEYDFRVGSGKPATGAWSLAERSGTALADSSGNGRTATLQGGKLGQPGRIPAGPTALNLLDSNASQWAATATPAVDTTQSFSVAAWVRPMLRGATRTVITQEGRSRGGFALQYLGDQDRWSFGMPAMDTHITSINSATAPVAARNTWTHLAGTYDAATRRLTLYVDGRKAAEKIAPTDAWAATGPLVIGRGKVNGGEAEPWTGDVADVRVWDRRIYLSEVTEVANQMTLVGEWKFDEPSGAVMTDTSEFRRDVKFTGGVWKRDLGVRGDGTSLTANDDFGTASGPVVNSTTGYAISAWLRLERPDHMVQTAVAADGQKNSPFALQYVAETKKWALRLTDADTDAPGKFRAQSQKDAVAGQWTHLVGVYDPGANQVRLYVNGQLEATVTAPTTWATGGPLTIGRGKWNGVNFDFWSGGIDNVQVFAGVPTDLDVVALYHQ